MRQLTAYLFCVIVCALQGKAQMFWKPYGTPTSPLSVHSALLYTNTTSTLYVSTWNQGIFSSTDQGQTWNHVLELPKDQPVLTLYELKDGTLLAGGKERIYKSTQGDKWEEIGVPLSDVNQFAEDSAGNIYICSSLASGLAEGIYISEDRGATWNPLNEGLTSKFVNHIFIDLFGHLFCTVSDEIPDNLFVYDQINKKWQPKQIHLVVAETSYKIRSADIKAITSTADSVFISFQGASSGIGIQGVFKNSISGVLNESDWVQEMRAPVLPFTSVVSQLLITKNNNFHASLQTLNPVIVFNKMFYQNEWASIKEGIDPKVSGLAFFCELPDGNVLLSAQNNQIYVTGEGIPGRKVQQISFDPITPLRLYDESILNARSSSGLLVGFKAMPDTKAYITGNKLWAAGTGTVNIKAFAPASEEYYYAEQIQTIRIAKAANKIEVDTIGPVPETSPGIVLNARASSGEPVKMEVVSGAAHIQLNQLIPDGPGPVLLRFTEPGNGSYDTADTVSVQVCITPKRPSLSLQSNTGVPLLVSGSSKRNYWYRDNQLIKISDDPVFHPKQDGIYQVQVNIDGCASEKSDQVILTSSGELEEGELKIYPVPFQDEIIIERKGLNNKELEASLVNMAGQKVWQQQLSQTLIRIPSRHLASGVYLLCVQSKNKRQTFILFK